MSNNHVALDWHESNLQKFRNASNGNRNVQLNTLALKSFSLALGCDYLSQSKVESDFTEIAKILQMDDSSVKGTLRSALSAATPHEFYDNGGNDNNYKHDDNSKASLAVTPVYTALEDYALAHGVPVSAFEHAKWTEGEFPYGQYKGVDCFLVPHEDGIVRARIKDPTETNGTKWLPIKPQGMKETITPCWYGFNSAVSMASKAAHKTIVICNGQPSVIAAQYHGIAALAQTDGENKLITDKLIKRLLAAIKEHSLKIIVAFDGDNTGREATAKILKQLRDNGVEVRAVYFGGNDGYDLADYCKQHKTSSMRRLIELSRYGQKKLSPVVSRSQLAANAHGMLTSPKENIPSGEMMIVPMKSFHKLGGYAEILEPGKMTMVLAPSGGGKTSFMECWSDHWNVLGYDTLFFSPEWTPNSLHRRSIQRYSGISTDDIRKHILYTSEVERGVLEAHRHGVEIVKGTDKYNKYLQTNERIATWPGQLHVLQGQTVTSEILEDMSNTIWQLRRDGRRVGAAIFDYAQILHTDQEENAKNSYEIICSEIKDWCGEMEIHAIIGSQPTKTRAEESKRNNKPLNEYDSMWVRPDTANLVIALHITYDEIDGQLTKTNTGLANVCKNSEGQEGQIKMKTNFKHLAWEEV